MMKTSEKLLKTLLSSCLRYLKRVFKHFKVLSASGVAYIFPQPSVVNHLQGVMKYLAAVKEELMHSVKVC